MTVESDYGFKMAARIKEIAPNCTVIFGGPHCAHEPEFILHDPNVDLMVVGESELTLPELMNALKNKTNVGMVKGICYKKDGEYMSNNLSHFFTNFSNFWYRMIFTPGTPKN